MLAIIQAPFVRMSVMEQSLASLASLSINKKSNSQTKLTVVPLISQSSEPPTSLMPVSDQLTQDTVSVSVPLSPEGFPLAH